MIWCDDEDGAVDGWDCKIRNVWGLAIYCPWRRGSSSCHPWPRAACSSPLRNRIALSVPNLNPYRSGLPIQIGVRLHELGHISDVDLLA